MISIQLKQETSQLHTEFEKLLIPPLKNVQSFSDYTRILKLFYGFFSPVEQLIDRYVERNPLPDIAERRKSQLILDDLQSFDLAVDVQPCSNLPEISDTASAFGGMYVLEKSTLGGNSDPASGLMAVPLQAEGDFLLLFKPQVTQTESGGCNPNEALGFEDDGKSYHPRNSFRLWQNLVNHRSHPWNQSQLAAALQLQNALLKYIYKPA